MAPDSSSHGQSQVLIVAAEASSSLYAQRLLNIWKEQKKSVHAFGIGNKAMEAQGFEILGRSEDMSVVGFQEVIAHYSQLKAVFNKLVEEAEKRKPDFVILMDYSGFNLRLAKKLKPLGLKVVYFISPQVWAWRKGRLKTIQQFVDKMLVILPFEQKFYEKNGVSSEFVGHPLLDELAPELFNEKDRDFSRKKFGLNTGEFLLGIMPGSRKSEIKFNLKSQIEAAQLVLNRNPQIKIALLVAPTFEVEEFKSYLPPIDFPFVIMRDDPYKMVSLCDGVLCASGTATLVVGLMEKPMVIMYKVNAITAFIGRRLVKVDHFGLINLILGERAVPELFQEQATPVNMAREIEKFVRDSDYYQAVKAKLAQARFRLGEKGAMKRVAAAVAPYFKSHP
jgi:lipid-A-disaccharide synthase